MKKYFLGMTMVSMLSIVNIGIAMEKQKKEIKTSLSSKQVAELRGAVKGIKNKPLAESRKEQLIVSKYGDKYYTGSSNDDPFVRAKVREASRAYKLKKYGPDYREID